MSEPTLNRLDVLTVTLLSVAAPPDSLIVPNVVVPIEKVTLPVGVLVVEGPHRHCECGRVC